MVLVVGGMRQAAWKTRAHFFKHIKAALILKKFFSSLSLFLFFGTVAMRQRFYTASRWSMKKRKPCGIHFVPSGFHDGKKATYSEICVLLYEELRLESARLFFSSPQYAWRNNVLQTTNDGWFAM